MFKKILSLVLVSTFLLCFNANVTAETTTKFTDVKAGSWYEQYVQPLIDEGYTSGVGNNKFGVGQSITNAEVITFMLRIIDKQPASLVYDATKGEAWYTPYYNKAVEVGIVNNSDVTKATSKATRKEVAVLMYRALMKSDKDFAFTNKLNLPETLVNDVYETILLEESTKYYRDYADMVVGAVIPYEVVNATNYLYNRGILVGDERNNCKPNAYITREETAAFLVRVFDSSYRVWAIPYTDKVDVGEKQDNIPKGVLKMNAIPTSVSKEMLDRMYSYDIIPLRRTLNLANGGTEEVAYYAVYELPYKNMEWRTTDDGINEIGTPNLRIASEFALNGKALAENRHFLDGTTSYYDTEFIRFTNEINKLFNNNKSEVKILTEIAIPHWNYGLDNYSYRYIMYFRTSDLSSCMFKGVTKVNTWYEIIFDAVPAHMKKGNFNITFNVDKQISEYILPIAVQEVLIGS